MDRDPSQRFSLCNSPCNPCCSRTALVGRSAGGELAIHRSAFVDFFEAFAQFSTQKKLNTWLNFVGTVLCASRLLFVLSVEQRMGHSLLLSLELNRFEQVSHAGRCCLIKVVDI
jgi:hypothetical protein